MRHSAHYIVLQHEVIVESAENMNTNQYRDRNPGSFVNFFPELMRIMIFGNGQWNREKTKEWQVGPIRCDGHCPRNQLYEYRHVETPMHDTRR